MTDLTIRLETEKDYIILDVRTIEEYEEGHYNHARRNRMGKYHKRHYDYDDYDDDNEYEYEVRGTYNMYGGNYTMDDRRGYDNYARGRRMSR